MRWVSSEGLVSFVDRSWRWSFALLPYRLHDGTTVWLEWYEWRVEPDSQRVEVRLKGDSQVRVQPRWFYGSDV